MKKLLIILTLICGYFSNAQYEVLHINSAWNSRHNLDLLALKKPGMIELRFNNASESVMEGLENDTEELYKLTVPNTTD